jgi:hypothetical protein
MEFGIVACRREGERNERERGEKGMGNGRKKRGLNGGLSGALRMRMLTLERACDETMALPAGNKSLPKVFL